MNAPVNAAIAEAYIDKVPTAFKLPPGAAAQFRAVAGKLLNQSETYRALLRELASDLHQAKRRLT